MRERERDRDRERNHVEMKRSIELSYKEKSEVKVVVPYLTKEIHLAQRMKTGKFSLAMKNPPRRVEPITQIIERVRASFILAIAAPIIKPMELLNMTNRKINTIKIKKQ